MIMDGNGRWAQQRGQPRVEGHRRGAETVRMVTETAAAWKLHALTLYCLSSENWKRPQQEIDFLMQLLLQYLVEERDTLMENDIRLRVIGRRDRLPIDVQSQIDQAIEMSAGNGGTQLVLAIDYGGRDEIVRGMRRHVADLIDQRKISPDTTLDDLQELINEPDIAAALDTHGIPDPDLLIRTGGEMRISNYLLWQVSYSELYVTETCWPEFSQDDFTAALVDYAARHRRYGGL